MIFNSLRPVILNGIEDVGTRSDLLDRAIRVALPSIPEDQRQPERVIHARFETVRPGIMGALLDAVSMAMANVATVQLDRLPRMADFAQWVVAAEPALPCQPGDFMRAYCDNRAGAHELALEAEPVGEAILRFAQQHADWAGKPTELLTALNGMMPESAQRQGDWPKKPHNLTGILKRLAPNLRAMHVVVDFNRTGRRRQIIIRTVGQNSVTSVTERHFRDSGAANGVSGDADVTLGDAEVTLPDIRNGLHVTLGDAGDAVLQTDSNGRFDDELEERMAIMEFEGGLCRADAEVRARLLHNGHVLEAAR